MFLDYKRLSLPAIANNTALNYQKLQYFFSEADWNTKELNDIRIKILQNQRTTKANKDSVLAIDDTACPKPHAFAELIIIDSAFLLSKNKDIAVSLDNIKSERFKKKLEN